MKSCKKYEELIERYLSAEILIEEQDDLEKHLAVCRECANLYSEISDIDSLLRNVPGHEVEPPPHLKTRIMARIQDEKPEKLWAFSFKPIYGLAAAVLALLLVGTYAFFSRPTVVRVVNLTTTETKKPADFYAPQFTRHNGERVIREVKIFLYYPDARKVSITGDFNNWDTDGLPLIPTGKKGLWEINLRFKPGVYSYNFIIDGNIIVPDPNSANQAPDGFGGMNSVLFVGGGETS